LSNQGAASPQRPQRPFVRAFRRTVTTSFGRPVSISSKPQITTDPHNPSSFLSTLVTRTPSSFSFSDFDSQKT
jgi:hypothetical protein